MRFIFSALLSLALASRALASPLGYELNLTTTITHFNRALNDFSIVYDGSQSSSGPFPPAGPTALFDEGGAPSCPNPPCFSHYTARVAASADLATGKLGAYADAFGGEAGEQVTALVLAQFADTLVFHLPQGTPSTAITLSMNVHATLPANPHPPAGLFSGEADLGLGGAGDLLFWDQLSPGGPFAQVLSVTATVEDGVPIDVIGSLRGELVLTRFSPSDAGFPFDPGPGPFVWDALHTAALSMDVPAGVTYESESRVFLSQVSEPSALPLVLFGVPGISAATRFRRSRRGCR
jgi:hypothetical protein